MLDILVNETMKVYDINRRSSILKVSNTRVTAFDMKKKIILSLEMTFR